MGLADMIKLGSYGYKISEIKELKEKGIETNEILRLAENGYSAADVNELISFAGAGEQVQPGNEEQNNSSGPVNSPENDGAAVESEYKNKYEEMTREMEELKKQLTNSQQQNSQKNLAGSGDTKTPRELVQQAFRELY